MSINLVHSFIIRVSLYSLYNCFRFSSRRLAWGLARRTLVVKTPDWMPISSFVRGTLRGLDLFLSKYWCLSSSFGIGVILANSVLRLLSRSIEPLSKSTKIYGDFSFSRLASKNNYRIESRSFVEMEATRAQGDWNISYLILTESAFRIWGCWYWKGKMRPRNVSAVKLLRLADLLTKTTVF